MNTKLTSFYLDSFDLNFEVIALTETWLRDKPGKTIYNSEIMCNKFQIYRRDRVGRDGGGVLIAISATLASEEIISHAPNDIEFISTCIKLENRKIFITCSYIPPSSNLYTYELHLKAIENIMQQSETVDSVIVLGDFNLPHLTWHESPDSNFLSPSTSSELNTGFIDSIAELGLFQLNNIHNTLGRILDLVFVDVPDDFKLIRLDPLIKPEDVFHPCLGITMYIANHQTTRQNTCNELVFNFKKADFAALNYMLLNENWFEYNSCCSRKLAPKEIDSILDLFYTGLFNCFKRTIPMVKRRVTSGPPWNTKQLSWLKNTKNKYYKKYKKSGLNSDYALYSIYRSLYNMSNIQAYKVYLLKVRTNFKSNPKSFFSICKL